MNTQIISNFKHISTRLSAVLLSILLLLPACSTPAQPPRIEEITFQSGEFSLVGELRTPAGSGPFPVVLFVHGSGYADRTMFGMYLPVMERMLRAGYAVFSWDNPGAGESTGRIDETRVYRQRAQIVLDAIDAMKARPDIDPQRIGLWGISQGGYVMPLALSQTKDIAFMICVSCAGVSGDDQLAFQRISQAICDGVPAEKDAELRSLLAELDTARKIETYPEYRLYREVLDALAGLGSPTPDLAGLGAVPEQAWRLNDPEYQGWWNPVRVIEQTKNSDPGHQWQQGYQPRSGPGSLRLEGSYGESRQLKLPRGAPTRTQSLYGCNGVHLHKGPYENLRAGAAGPGIWIFG